MKELLVIRHAKSSWANLGQDDFDRPLNERGIKDAPEMARRIIARSIMIDTFISSTAKRALYTATCFAEAFHKSVNDINQKQELYHAPSERYYQVIKKINPLMNTVAIFAHNPGITDFVNSLKIIHLDNMPTCGVFAVKLHTTEWSEFNTCKKDFWFFDYPKLEQ